MQGRTMERAGYRSSRRPVYGEQAATVSAATVNASDTCALLQPNSAVSGFKKMPNVKTRSDPKLTKPPQHAAARIRAGWRGLNRGEWRGLRTAGACNAVRIPASMRAK